MPQRFFCQTWVRSTLSACLLLSGMAMFSRATVASSPMVTVSQTEAIAGRKLDNTAKAAQEVPPPDMITMAIALAKAWGYPTQRQPRFSRITTEQVIWASGCETISAPYACDPVARQGWKITIPHRRQHWVLQGETATDLQLIARNNPTVEQRLPIAVRDEIKRIASQHLQLPPGLILITTVEPQTFSDGCLGLGNLAESCSQQMMPGYRVTVAGQGSEQQIYRISEDGLNLRTEAIAGLPSRTDELPTAIVRTILNTAASDFGQPMAHLSITQVEAFFACFRSPTAAPDEPCLPIKRLDGWVVTVTDFQNSLAYTVNLTGEILESTPFPPP